MLQSIEAAEAHLSPPSGSLTPREDAKLKDDLAAALYNLAYSFNAGLNIDARTFAQWAQDITLKHGSQVGLLHSPTVLYHPTLQCLYVINIGHSWSCRTKMRICTFLTQSKCLLPAFL